MVTEPREGMRVRVPWGPDRFLDGEIVEVWPDVNYVRVRLFWGLDEDGYRETSIVPLSPEWIQPAA